MKPVPKAAASANCSFLALFYCSVYRVVLMFVSGVFVLFVLFKWLRCYGVYNVRFSAPNVLLRSYKSSECSFREEHYKTALERSRCLGMIVVLCTE